MWICSHSHAPRCLNDRWFVFWNLRSISSRMRNVAKCIMKQIAIARIEASCTYWNAFDVSIMFISIRAPHCLHSRIVPWNLFIFVCWEFALIMTIAAGPLSPCPFARQSMYVRSIFGLRLRWVVPMQFHATFSEWEPAHAVSFAQLHRNQYQSLGEMQQRQR